MINLLKINKNYRFLYLAGFFSEFGSFVTEQALMLLVFKLTGEDKAWLGMSRATFLLCLSLGMIIAGPLSLKFNRRNLLIFTNLCRIPIVFLLLTFKDPYIIVLCNGLIALFTGIYNPTRQTVVNEVVGTERIQQANSLFGSTMATLHLVCPFLGAYFYSYFGGITEIVSFDLLTYLLGIGLLFNMKYVQDQTKVEDSTMIKDLKEGFRYALSRKDILGILVNTAVAGLAIGVLIPLILPFVLENLGGTETEYGLMMSLFGVGGIIGGIFSPMISKRFSDGKIIMIGILIESLMMLTWSLIEIKLVNFALILCWGVLVFARVPSQLNYLSYSVETHLLSRVHSLMDMSFVVPNILGALFVSLIGNQLTTQNQLIIFSLIFIALTWGRIFSKQVREIWEGPRVKVNREAQSGI